MKLALMLFAVLLAGLEAGRAQTPVQQSALKPTPATPLSAAPAAAAPATPVATSTPVALPARIELTGGAEVRVVPTEEEGAAVAKQSAPVSIVLYAPPAPVPTNNLGVRGGNHDPSNWSVFVDGSAAVFGVLSAIIAMTILILALRGMHDYKALKTQLAEEVRRDVSAQVVERLIKDAMAGIGARVSAEAELLQKRILEQAEGRLRDETLKLADEMAQKDDFRREVSQRVAALLTPAPKATTPDEFDEPPAA